MYNKIANDLCFFANKSRGMIVSAPIVHMVSIVMRFYLKQTNLGRFADCRVVSPYCLCMWYRLRDSPNNSVDDVGLRVVIAQFRCDKCKAYGKPTTITIKRSVNPSLKNFGLESRWFRCIFVRCKLYRWPTYYKFKLCTFASYNYYKTVNNLAE